MNTLMPEQREPDVWDLLAPTAFVPVMKQPTLLHQFDLQWVLAKTHVAPICNCGWRGMAYKPDKHAEKFHRALQDYQDHLYS